MMTPIYVVGRGAVTSAGATYAEQWRALCAGVPRFVQHGQFGAMGKLDERAESCLDHLQREPALRHADRVTLLAVMAAREASAEARLDPARVTAVVLGSSRGATTALEAAHCEFLEKGRVPAHTSPVTTAGTLAGSVAQDLDASGPAFAISSACATGLNAIGTAAALIGAGQADQAIAGGAEASLTDFTLAQLHAARVSARRASALFPARPMHPERSGMVPGEGAACVALASAAALQQSGASPYARLLGFGAATERSGATGISADGQALVLAIERACAAAQLGPDAIDLVIGHGASTMKGDAAEKAAYRQVFGSQGPRFTFHKWLTGHMIGASGAYSAVLATTHLATGEVPGLPYFEDGVLLGEGADSWAATRVVLVTALGFGGAASALLLAAP